MARKPASTVGPDLDDLDGQGGIIVNPSTGASNDGTINPAELAGAGTGAGAGADSFDGGTDEYVRDAGGTILRNKDGSPKRKRGRKAGSSVSGGKSSAPRNNQTLKESIDSLASMIGFAHMGIAVFLKSPEMELDETESEKLAKATANVLAQFEIKPNPRVEAIVGLAAVAGPIYYSRYYLISERRKQERKDKKASQESNLFPFPGPDQSHGAN